MIRFRFEGLRLPALSAPSGAPLSLFVTLHRLTKFRVARLCNRGSHANLTGGHSPLARLVACLLIIGMLGISAPVLIPVFRWIFSLL
jgi:hypothetical protein